MAFDGRLPTDRLATSPTPYGYQRSDDGYVLWSVGLDQVDDHGGKRMDYPLAGVVTDGDLMITVGEEVHP